MTNKKTHLCVFLFFPSLFHSHAISQLLTTTYSCISTGRDVVQELIRKSVSSDKDFSWVAQLRYYWVNELVQVDMITTRLQYGYEYLGNTSRLVVTPLTERCFRWVHFFVIVIIILFICLFIVEWNRDLGIVFFLRGGGYGCVYFFVCLCACLSVCDGAEWIRVFFFYGLCVGIHYG